MFSLTPDRWGTKPLYPIRMVRRIGNRCVARRADGRQCYSTGVRWAVGVPFCQAHALELAEAFGAPDPVRVVEVSTVGSHVVYYVGDPETQLIKIGTSHDHKARFVALCTRKPGLKLLAVEPGHFDLETMRHLQFRRLRERGEWFRRDPALMEHVNEVRARWGDPFAYLPKQAVI